MSAQTERDAIHKVQNPAEYHKLQFGANGLRKIVDGDAAPADEIYSGFYVTVAATISGTAINGGDNLANESLPVGFFPGLWKDLTIQAADTGVVWGIIAAS